MAFNKYSAIYKNDRIKINDDEVKGIVKEIKEYLLYEIANQIMAFEHEEENLIHNMRITADIIEELQEEENDKKIIVKYNSMGSLYYMEDTEEREIPLF